ncbi:hypothetical protein IAT38_007941 [Cryptococcus sp. DSM 104549]
MTSVTVPDFEGAAIALYIQQGYGLAFGPYIIGYGMELFLMGIIGNQMYRYFWDSGRDKLWMQAAVWWCVALSFATTVYLLHWMMHLFVWNYGTYSHFYVAESYSWVVIFDVLTTTIVQAVYAERAYRITNRLTSVASGIAIKVLSYNLVTESAQATYRNVYLLWVRGVSVILNENHANVFYVEQLATVMSADLLITASIMFALRRTKTRWEDTDKVINKLTRLSAEVQLPATLVSIVFIITYIVHSICSISVFCQLLQPAVHVVGLLSMLNSRVSLRVQLGSHQAHSETPDDKHNSIPLAAQSAATGSSASGGSQSTLVRGQEFRLGTTYLKA